MFVEGPYSRFPMRLVYVSHIKDFSVNSQTNYCRLRQLVKPNNLTSDPFASIRKGSLFYRPSFFREMFKNDGSESK